MKKILYALVAVILVVLNVTPVLADTTAVVTILGIPLYSGGILSFNVVYVSDTEMDLNWTVGPGVENVMVRAKYGSPPSNPPNENTVPTDGYLVYYGSDLSAVDTSMDFNDNAGILYYTAWAQKLDGTWNLVSSSGSEESKEVILLSFIGTILAVGMINFGFLRNSFMPYKLAGAFLWVIPIVWVMSNPPSIFTAGSALQAVTLIVLIGIGLISLFGSFRRELQMNKTSSKKNGEYTSEGSISNAWHMPTIFQGENEEKQIQQARVARRERRAEYRARFQQALKGDEEER